MSCVHVASIPQISAPTPPARKKYTLAEVFGDDDDDNDGDEAEEMEAVAAAGAAVGRQDYGQPPAPGILQSFHR